MAATSDMIRQLRLMTNEPSATSAYSDIDLKAAIEQCPISDDDGNAPDHIDWVAGYDLHTAAAAIWQQKAAIAAQDYNFAADGRQYSRSNVYEQYMKQVRYHEARRQPQTIMPVVAPPIEPVWIGNLPEED